MPPFGERAGLAADSDGSAPERSSLDTIEAEREGPGSLRGDIASDGQNESAGMVLLSRSSTGEAAAPVAMVETSGRTPLSL